MLAHPMTCQVTDEDLQVFRQLLDGRVLTAEADMAAYNTGLSFAGRCGLLRFPAVFVISASQCHLFRFVLVLV